VVVEDADTVTVEGDRDVVDEGGIGPSVASCVEAVEWAEW
jgi:hypothetical protein